MFALIDANNFYCAVERVWQPRLEGRAVVVASNNDGCAISRSDPAKALDIKMGQPLFQIRSQFKDADVVILSANFTLYGSMSDRMMSIASVLGTAQEIYSIDESFIDLTGISDDLTVRGHRMRRRILQWTGLPTGIGIGRTKTLAKLANHVAKSAWRKPGSYPVELAQVCNLASLCASDFESVLQATDVTDIWGIGRRIGAQLHAAGIHTALDVIRMDPGTVRRRWSVVLERTVRELQGQSCIALDDAPPAKREIACTRSFGRPVTDLAPLVEAVSEFAGRAAEKLRLQNGMAGQILTFIQTSPFRQNDRQYARSITTPMRRPTADTGLLTQSAIAGLKAIYRPDFRYAKAGVMLLDLQDASVEQCELDLDGSGPDRSELMAVMDRINMRYGRGTLKLASAGIATKLVDVEADADADHRNAGQRWQMKQQHRTQDYMTDWNALPLARA
jgi:DNA polymerase V